MCTACMYMCVHVHHICMHVHVHVHVLVHQVHSPCTCVYIYMYTVISAQHCRYFKAVANFSENLVLSKLVPSIFAVLVHIT